MKLSTTCYSILILVISVDCGLVKDFFGNVKEDVHNVVDNTVNIIGKGTHKITEGFGLFLHRKEGTKFPEYESVIPINQVSYTEKIDNDGSKFYKPEGEANHGQTTHPTVDKSINDNKHLYDPQNVANKEYTTESNTNKNDKPEITTKKYKQDLESMTSSTTTTTTESTTASTTTTTESITTSATSTTENVLWSNGVELENILPNIMHDDTASENKNSSTVTDSESFTNTNELGTGESNVLGNKTIELAQSNKTAKCDEDIKPTESQTKDHNLISDQIFFKDNKLEYPITNNHNACPKGLVRAANGDCLERREIDVREKNESKVSAVFEADGCPTNYSRAEDNSCQKIIG